MAIAGQAGAMDLPASLHAVALAQRGVVIRPPLLEHGVTISQVRWHLGRSWRQVLPGVILLGPAPPTPEQRLVTALLYGGPGSWLAGPTAAHALGLLANEPTHRVHLLAPPSTRPREVQWVSLRRTYLLDERLVERGPLRISCRPRAVVDAAAALDDDRARTLVIDAVRRRLVRLDDLAHWVEVRENRGRPRLRSILQEAAAGAWSVPEADLAALVRTSRVLPGKRLTTSDLWIDDVGMAIMVHSRQFHAGALQWNATVADDSDLSSYRIVLAGVTPEELARDPPSVLRRLETQYRAARASGFRPAVIATPR